MLPKSPILVENLMKSKNSPSNKLENKIRHLTGKAIFDYNMIEENDKIVCGLSGGKDSFVMLDTLLHLKRVAPIKFDVIAVNLDQKQPGFPEHILPNYLEQKGIDYYIIDKDTYSVVKQKIPEGKTTCSLCSRLRRGSLYGFAETIGATKIALGHHMDDIVETLMMNMFNNAKLKAMPPKLLSDDKRNIIIRPLAYCREKDIAQLAELNDYPISCNLCGSQENLQRKKIKKMLSTWDEESPGRVENVFKSTQNVSLSQLSDTSLCNFSTLTIDRTAEPKEQEFGGADISSSNLIDIKNIEITDAS